MDVYVDRLFESVHIRMRWFFGIHNINTVSYNIPCV